MENQNDRTESLKEEVIKYLEGQHVNIDVFGMTSLITILSLFDEGKNVEKIEAFCEKYDLPSERLIPLCEINLKIILTIFNNFLRKYEKDQALL